MMFREMKCWVKKYKKFSDLYESQKFKILYNCIKTDKITNIMIFNLVTLQLVNSLSVQKTKQKSKYSIKMRAEHVRKCFW